jgi:hypothetical protein
MSFGKYQQQSIPGEPQPFSTQLYCRRKKMPSVWKISKLFANRNYSTVYYIVQKVLRDTLES